MRTFYSNGSLLNTDTAAPYTFTYSGLGSGSYAFTAKATDNRSAATTSSAVTVSVNHADGVADGAQQRRYDGLDNLTRVDQGSRHYRYSYNYAGNQRLAQINDPNGVPQIVLGYDAAGNVSSKNGQALVFDVANRLTQMTGIQNYRYDGLGRRVQTTDADGKYTFWQYSRAGQVLFASEARKSRNTSYIYLGNTQVAARHVAWGSGTATIDYQHTDALGSPVAETNTS